MTCLLLTAEYLGKMGFQLKFTFIPVNDIPTPVTGGLYDCSKPSFLAFKDHVRCNRVIECLGVEDEEGCDYTSVTCLPGYIQFGDR